MHRIHIQSATETPTKARRILPISVRAGWTTPCLAIAFALLFSVSAAAGTVSGRVYDPDGNPVKNTFFTATAKPARGEPVDFKTDPLGNFSVYLDPGRYIVSPKGDASLQGEIDSYPQPLQQDIRLKKK